MANVDVRGKIAVLQVVLNDSLFDSRERGVANAAVKAGALGAINVIDSPGNMHYVDGRYGCGTGACFAVGGEDGAFLENAIGAAAKAGVGPITARLSLESESREHLSAANAVATIPGRSDKVIIVSAHADGWFDGANDNADGLAALIGEAGYFAERGMKPEHTLIFMATAGHHNAGNGAAAYIKAHPDVISRLSLMINLEHLAQLSTVPSSPAPASVGFPGVPVATTTETPKQVGISTASPYLIDLFTKAAARYSIVTVSKPSSSVPGDAGPYLRIRKPAVQLISAGTFYHSTGDVEGLISKSGLERAAAFWADFITSVDHATDAQIQGH
jgi:Zn-dependent M28 family amino/carboxypeptidase